MNNKIEEKGIHQLYRDDAELADELIWDRKVDPASRRGFLRNSGLLAMSAALGASIPFADKMPGGLIPAALANTDQPFKIAGKDQGLVVLNDRPLSVETPPHLLDDLITPADKIFIRNNGVPPVSVDPATWVLNIGGESVESNVQFSLDQLKKEFKQYTYQLTIECAGNGRHEFNPPAKGTQWTTGAIASPEWTGIRLRDVLKKVGIKDDAVYVGFYGRDTHLSGNPDRVPISRGIPMHKALEKKTLIAWAVNGEDIPLMNGYPLRLVCGGWPASTSGKWLEKIVVRNKIHDGEKMQGYSYKVPCNPVAPGTKVLEKEMCIIESMPVKSLITFPQSGLLIKLGHQLLVRGHAWAGDLKVSAMEVSIDFGVTWQPGILQQPKNRLAWQHWSAKCDFPEKGYYEVWARAKDSSGNKQPMVIPGWNPKGYLNNACHRIAVKVI
ncbi:MAG: sulfite oxidase [Methylococcaceae bacterium]|nr:sulfite oxidase [Methylococcaceae bacterium]